MRLRTWLVPFLAALVVIMAAVPQAPAAQRSHRYTIEPGQSRVFMCGWGYGPIAREQSLRVGRRELELRGVTRTSPNSLRVVFAHRVTVREDGGGLYRAIINRGRATITYRDWCAGGGASY
ncbi:MAG: hypothetical protein ACXWZM_05710 [Solirubrobacterales bacterium]